MRLLLALFLLSSVAFAQNPLVEEDRYRFVSPLAPHGMALAEPLAAEAAIEVMKQGGNAVDAAVTAALTMAVTLPRAGNLGGGGFMVIRTPKGEVTALDFREMAPARATRDMYLNPDGKVNRDRATVGALSVGVPGTVAGCDEALKRYGTISLAKACEPGLRIAQKGYVVPAWMTDEIAKLQAKLARFPESAAIYLPGGQPLAPNTRWVQPDLAWSFRQLQARGRDGFYRGPVAERLVAAITRHGGMMTLEDLANYKAVWRTPIKGTYRGYTVWSMPPPSSGGVHLIQALNVLEGYDLQKLGPNSAATLHRMVETLRQVYADRSKWLGDPDFVKVPVAWLTSKAYAGQIRAAIGPQARKSADVKPGQYESPQTAHLCTMDDKGWAVSLTYTLNFSYGSMLVAEGTGILLNNEMDDFSAAPGKPNAFGLLGGEANAIQPGKRPLSSMTPTVIEKDGQLYAAVGSPGGSHIITSVLQVILNLIDFDQNSQTAVSEPRIHHQWYPDQIDIEQGFSPDTLALLTAWGHKLSPVNALGHVMLIVRKPDGMLEGGCDPRRSGAAAVGW